MSGRADTWTPERRARLSKAQRAAWARRRPNGKPQRLLSTIFDECHEALQRAHRRYLNAAETLRRLDQEGPYGDAARMFEIEARCFSTAAAALQMCMELNSYKEAVMAEQDTEGKPDDQTPVDQADGAAGNEPEPEPAAEESGASE